MKKLFTLILFLCAFFSMETHAVVLWDQAPDSDRSVDPRVDQEFPDFPDYSTYAVGDVTVGGDGWVVESVSTFFTDELAVAWPGTADGQLHVFDKTSPLPAATDLVPAGNLLNGTLTAFGTNVLKFTVDNLGLVLAPGDYWIGFTPSLDFGRFGQEFHSAAVASVVGDPTAFRNPGGGFGVGTDWNTDVPLEGSGGDYALRIEGSFAQVSFPELAIPEPGMLGLFCAGLLGGFSVRKLRRS